LAGDKFAENKSVFERRHLKEHNGLFNSFPQWEAMVFPPIPCRLVLHW